MVMNDTMAQMLPLMMLAGGSGSGTGTGEDGAGMGELLKVLMGQGDDVQVEALYANGAVGGTARDRNNDQGIGVLELMVLPPHAGDPHTRLRIKTNGPIICTPDQVKQIGKQFLALAESPEVAAAYEQGKEGEEQAAADAAQQRQQQAMMGALT
jgi:pyruvate/2-oxoglutarate dehydrogenase complex dihydrolipoamide acyltransferase (E2) component